MEENLLLLFGYIQVLDSWYPSGIKQLFLQLADVFSSDRHYVY